MKKNNIFHPKLYFRYESHQQNIKLFYYSNRLNHLGERLVEQTLLDINSFSQLQLNEMNKEQYHNLIIYIKRQEKVMETYLKKGFQDQYLIVQNSIKLMYGFKKDFENWCLGKTGFPLVDAGMRELNKTGFMHNRVRMLVGSFLCKHLLIDWRWGEAYFAEKLFDYEMSSNVGNWQWVAGCGVDAAPYFRIFNPTEQVKKFDKQLHYINKWVPEFQEISYPKPIIDHKLARERCLKTYKSALNS